jgi:uncharacterized protein (TIGR03083 family)
MSSSFRVLALDHCALIAADCAGLADAAEGNLDARVEFCPGWSVADLVRHVWDVHAFWAQIVARRLADPGDYVAPPEPSDDDLIATFRAGATRLVEILRATDPATAVWTWARQHDAGFVRRHQVQEAAVHRWDAERAAGHSFAIDRDGAVDAVDEFLTVSLSPKPKTELTAPVALVATDAEVAWTVRPGAGGVLTPVAGIDDDATQVRATASDLLLWLYRRRPAASVEVVGDAGLPPVLSAYGGTD